MERKIDLNGVIDMHVHTNPDLRNRMYDDFRTCQVFCVNLF